MAMEPGPAVTGMVRGKNARSSIRVCNSSCSPALIFGSRFSIRQAVWNSSSPPATLITGIEMPNSFSSQPPTNSSAVSRANE